MSNYGNDSSGDDSSEEIGFPKTPGQPLVAHHSDDNSDNESNKSSSASKSDSESESEQSDHEQERKSDSENENEKKSASEDSDRDKSSSESDSDNEITKPASNNSNSSPERSNNESKRNKEIASSSSSSDEVEENEKASSDSDDSHKFSRERKRKQPTLESSDESDLDQNEPNDKSTTAKDLFGELSDEEEEPKNNEDEEDRHDNKKARISDDEDEDEEMPQADKEVMNNIFGEDEDEEEMLREREFNMEEEEEAPLPERRIEVEIPRIISNLGNGVHFVKLPNFLSIDTHPYDPLTYEDEIDEDEVHDDEGRARLKLKVENTIRWRNVVDDDGTITKESNSRIVKWSDGSMSLHLGDEIFDIQTLNLLPGENNHLYIRQGTGLQGQAVFRTKLTFRPFSTESFTHRKLTLSLADRSQKTQKICVLPSVGKDPEAHRSEMIKKEESKLKASILKESKQKRVKDRFFGRGPNSSYLENDEDDDESISISKIKNQYKRGPALSGSHFSGDESESEVSDDDDDSDLDFEKKKHTEKKQIVESDEEED